MLFLDPINLVAESIQVKQKIIFPQKPDKIIWFTHRVDP
jgi:hypothetical protein